MASEDHGINDRAGYVWPHGERVAVVFNVMLDGYSPGIPPAVGLTGTAPAPNSLDMQGMSWMEYAPKRGIYRILRLLARHGLRASIFPSLVLAERCADALRTARDGGHEICAHGYAQERLPANQSEEDERRTIRECTERLAEIVGRRPVGWISPFGKFSRSTVRLLAEAGYQHHGDCYDDDLPYVEHIGEERIAAIPLLLDIIDMNGLVRHGNPPLTLLAAFEDSLEQLGAAPEPSMIQVIMHAHVAGRSYVASVFDRIMRVAASRSDIWIATREEIAHHVLALDATK